jgi:hypothetical protein
MYVETRQGQSSVRAHCIHVQLLGARRDVPSSIDAWWIDPNQAWALGLIDVKPSARRYTAFSITVRMFEGVRRRIGQCAQHFVAMIFARLQFQLNFY